MAVEVATLQFKADTRDLKKVERILDDVGDAANDASHEVEDLNRDLKRTGTSAKGAAKEAGNLTSMVKKAGVAAAALAAAMGLISFGKGLIETRREFDAINAALVTVTGSTEAAARAFGRIQEFAATTPYDLAQVSNAFIQLKNRGMNSSEEAMKSYGNTAAALSRDLGDFVAAVANATVGNRESLKTFGITAKAVGDDLIFTFNKTETKVKNSASAIEEYLISIGESDKFKAGMDNRAATVDGALSNMEDAWSAFLLTFGSGSVGEGFDTFIRGVTEGVEEFTDAMAVAKGTANTKQMFEAAADDAFELSQTVERMGPVMAELLNYEERLAMAEKVRFHWYLQFKREKDKEKAEIAGDQIGRLDQSRAEADERLKIAITSTDAMLLEWQQYVDRKNEISRKAAEKERASAEQELDRLMSLNDTELQAITKDQDEKEASLQELRSKGIISAKEYEDALIEIMQYGAGKRHEIAYEALEAQNAMIAKDRERKLENLHAENDSLMEGLIEQDEARKQRESDTTDTLLAFEDKLLEGKDDRLRAGAQMAINFANQEKRENAQSIISNSYDAAMKAYSALAGIPIIGPALGAAAAGTVLAAGVTFAAQSMQGRALGGQVRGGESYVVGERGPEVLTMGSKNASITPNSSLGGSNSKATTNNNNVTINVSSAGGNLDNKSLQQIQQGVYRSLVRASVRNA